jgi:hypothetical protein
MATWGTAERRPRIKASDAKRPKPDSASFPVDGSLVGAK